MAPVIQANQADYVAMSDQARRMTPKRAGAILGTLPAIAIGIVGVIGMIIAKAFASDNPVKYQHSYAKASSEFFQKVTACCIDVVFTAFGIGID